MIYLTKRVVQVILVAQERFNMAKRAVTKNNVPNERESFPQSSTDQGVKSQPPVSMFPDDMGKCANRTNTGEGSQTKPSL